FPGQIVLDVAGGIEDRNRLAYPGITVGSSRHPVTNIVGQQLEPLVKAPLVEEPRFAVEELLHLAGDIFIYSRHVRLPPIRCCAALGPSSLPSSAAPSVRRTGDDCSRSCGNRWPRP